MPLRRAKRSAATCSRRPVPACPGWDVGELLRHLGVVERTVDGVGPGRTPTTIDPLGPGGRRRPRPGSPTAGARLQEVLDSGSGRAARPRPGAPGTRPRLLASDGRRTSTSSTRSTSPRRSAPPSRASPTPWRSTGSRRCCGCGSGRSSGGTSGGRGDVDPPGRRRPLLDRRSARSRRRGARPSGGRRRPSSTPSPRSSTAGSGAGAGERGRRRGRPRRRGPSCANASPARWPDGHARRHLPGFLPEPLSAFLSAFLSPCPASCRGPSCRRGPSRRPCRAQRHARDRSGAPLAGA